MLPIWTSFIIFSVVAATGSTFFLEEGDPNSPIQFFLMQSVTKFISDTVIEKDDKGKNAQMSMLSRIGVGMISSVLCCIAASSNAAYWLHLVKTYEEPERETTTVYRLTLQFVFLGLMEALSLEGLKFFFDSQISNSISIYGAPFGEFMMGIGKFVSVICIIVFRRWIRDDLNSSRLDKYYVVLTAFSFVIFLFYYYVARWYGEDIESSDSNVGEDIEFKIGNGT